MRTIYIMYSIIRDEGDIVNTFVYRNGKNKKDGFFGAETIIIVDNVYCYRLYLSYCVEIFSALLFGRKA